MIKDELIRFFWENYPGIREKYSVEDIGRMFARMDGGYSYKYKNGELVAVVIYLMVNDEYCDMIESQPELVGNPEFIGKCLENKGRNAHFIAALGAGAGNILWCLKEVIRRERPDSVSWYKDDLRYLHWIKRRKECLKTL